MKRTLVLGAIVLTLFGCAAIHHNNKNPYEKRLFVEKYLNPADPFDAQIQRTIDDLRADPRSATLHNQLGQLLLRKGFPKDAEREFDADRFLRAYGTLYSALARQRARGAPVPAGLT